VLSLVLSGWLGLPVLRSPPHNLANVPQPAGAVRVCDWDDVEHGDPHRYFVGSVVYRDDRDENNDENNDIEVWIDGVQRPDRIDRYIVVHQLRADYLINTKQAGRRAYLNR
jgi:hypothetical protein